MVTAIVGPSGSGKTTILNLISGLLTPDEGRITLQDTILFDSASGQNVPPEKRRIGYVFQDYQLFPHLKVLDNLRYGRKRARPPTFELEKVVATLELAGLLKGYPMELSGGQQQRVAIGRAILRDPKLLLLDEPVNSLDPQLRENVLEFLARIISQFQIPTLLVSHDRSHVSRLATGIVVL